MKGTIIKKIISLLVCILATFYISAQTKINPFIGTWESVRNDTVFRVKLIEGRVIKGSKILYPETIFGGYSLIVNAVTIENYIKNIPQTWDWNISTDAPHCYIYIWGGLVTNPFGFVFYDQRKQHADGEGLPCGLMEILPNGTLHWTLNEEEGLYWIYEGGEEPMPALRGFSVPTDVIMMRVLDNPPIKPGGSSDEDQITPIY